MLVASGDTTLAPINLPRLSQINFTNPFLKSSVLLRAIRFTVAIEVLIEGRALCSHLQLIQRWQLLAR